MSRAPRLVLRQSRRGGKNDAMAFSLGLDLLIAERAYVVSGTSEAALYLAMRAIAYEVMARSLGFGTTPCAEL